MKILKTLSTLCILLFFLTSVASAGHGYGGHHSDKYEKHSKYDHKSIKCDKNGNCFSCKNKKCTPLSNYTCNGKKCCKDGKCWPCKKCKNKPCTNCNDNNTVPPVGDNSTCPDGNCDNGTVPPVSDNETGTTTVNLCKGNTCVYGNNGKMTLVNHNDAVNPSYEQLIAFTKENKIDERSYNANSYNCQDFAKAYHDACEAAGIKAGFVGCDGMDHAFNVFQTTDKGIVYIDCTGVPGGKANQDKEITISGNKATGRYLVQGWTFTYDGSASNLEVYW